MDKMDLEEFIKENRPVPVCISKDLGLKGTEVIWKVVKFEDRAVVFEPRCPDYMPLTEEAIEALGLEGTARVETPERIVRVPVPPWVQLNALEPWNAEVVSVFQFESEAREGLLAYHKQATEILREDPVVRDFLERRLIGPLDGHYGTVSLDEREEKWFK